MTLHDLAEFIRLYVPAIALAATWTVLALVWLQRRRAWKRKSFLSLVNFSLNYLQDGALAMRTLLELPAETVWINEHGVGLVTGASRKTTLERSSGFRFRSSPGSARNASFSHAPPGEWIRTSSRVSCSWYPTT